MAQMSATGPGCGWLVAMRLGVRPWLVPTMAAFPSASFEGREMEMGLHGAGLNMAVSEVCGAAGSVPHS